MFDAITYALAKAFTKKAIEDVEAGSMRVEDYDDEGNGVVNDSRKLGGNLPSYYASTASIVGKMDKSVYDSNDNGIVDNAEKVNGHTVASDVPANAQFTDTTYSEGDNVSIDENNRISATDTKALASMTDTDFNDLADGETLIWDATNSKWVNGTIPGGGSYITLTTTTEQEENVSMSIGGATYTGTFSSEGVCIFEGVKEIGTATISTARVTTTLEIEYYGRYVASLVFVPAHIYGVYWDGTSSSIWTRTDESADFVDPNPALNNGTGSSPFDDLMPWAGMERVEDAEAGTLVKIPKFWYQLNIDDDTNTISLKIADGEVEGFNVSPAHMDRGDGVGERDFVYVGAYLCDSTYKSKTGVTPLSNIVETTARSGIHNLGATVWTWDIATYITLQFLYLVEYANWNSQSAIGSGSSRIFGTTSNSVGNTGVTDAMSYHTGTDGHQRLPGGQDEQRIRYRYIEDLWGNLYQLVDGITYKGTWDGSNPYSLKIQLNPSNFGSTYTGVDTALTPIGIGGVVTAMKQSQVEGLDWLWIPKSYSQGSASTYICDTSNLVTTDTSILLIIVGAYYNGPSNDGIMQFNRKRANNSGEIGFRLMKLPNNS